jgi:hypothetical protein
MADTDSRAFNRLSSISRTDQGFQVRNSETAVGIQDRDYTLRVLLSFTLTKYFLIVGLESRR